MKRVLGILFFLIILIVGVLIAAPFFISLDTYKKYAQDEFAKATGLELIVGGDVDLAFLPTPRISAEDVTVRAPQGKKYNDVAKLERAEVHVGLAGLLSKKVDVQSLTLVKPIIQIEKFKDGRFVFSKEAEAENQNAENPDVAQQPVKSNAAQIALNDITIEDGYVAYFDEAQNKEYIVSSINTELSAQDLMGPYTAKGSIVYEKNKIGFDLKSKGYDAENKLFNADLVLSLMDDAIGIKYDGVFDLSEGFSAQGQTLFAVKDAGQYSDAINDIGDATISGLLTADTKSVSYQNFNLKAADLQGSGSAKYNLENATYDVSLKTKGNVNIQEIVAADVGVKTLGFDLGLSGDLTKAKIAPSSVSIDGNALKISGDVSLNDSRQLSAANITVSTATLNIDDLMALTQKSSSKKSVQATNTAASSGATSQTNASMTLKANVSADTVIWQKKQIKGASAAFTLKGQKLVLDKVAVKDAGGASANVSGEIGNITTLKPLAIYLDAKTSDASKTLSFWDVDAKSLPPFLQSNAALKLEYKGSLEKADVTTNVDAKGLQIIASGQVSDVAKAPKLSDMDVQIKHSNMAQMLQLLTGAKYDDPSLQKSIDLFAKVKQSGNVISLTGVKGNLSGATLQGQASIDTGASVPSIQGDFTIGDVKLSSAMAAKSSGGSGSSSSSGAASSSASGRWSKEPINVQGLHSVNADLRLKANSIKYGAWDLKSPSLHILLQNGNLTISDLTANIFGGDIAANIALKSDAKPRQPIYFESTSSFKNADIGKLTQALMGTRLVKITGTGNVELSLKSSGASQAALIRDLNGSGRASGNDFILDGVDVNQFAKALAYDSKPGDTLTGLWDASRSGGQSAFDTLDGAFQIQNGIVTLEKMDLDGEKSAIETRGTVNLPNWTLATKHKIIVKGTEDVPSDVPPFEFSFNGSLDNPGQTFGKGLLQDYLNKKIERKLQKLISDKLLGGSNNNAPQNAQPTDQSNDGQQTPQPQQQKDMDIEDVGKEVLKGILGDILKQ